MSTFSKKPTRSRQWKNLVVAKKVGCGDTLILLDCFSRQISKNKYINRANDRRFDELSKYMISFWKRRYYSRFFLPIPILVFAFQEYTLITFTSVGILLHLRPIFVLEVKEIFEKHLSLIKKKLVLESILTTSNVPSKVHFIRTPSSHVHSNRVLSFETSKYPASRRVKVSIPCDSVHYERRLTWQFVSARFRRCWDVSTCFSLHPEANQRNSWVFQKPNSVLDPRPLRMKT